MGVNISTIGCGLVGDIVNKIIIYRMELQTEKNADKNLLSNNIQLN